MLHKRFIWRQLNSSRQQAMIFIFCVALSLLTLTSLGGFSGSVRHSTLRDARQLHAADITIHAHQPFSAPLLAAIRDHEQQGLLQGAQVHEFYSMANHAAQEKSILAQLKVVAPGYPFYGRVELASGREFAEVLKPGRIVVEQSALDRLEAKVGDRLRMGGATLTIADIVTVEPDRPVSFFSFGPRIFVAAADLAALDLISKGSRIQYNYLLKVRDPEQVDRLAEVLAKVATEPRERVRTFRTADSRVKRFFDNLLFFLNLIGIFTLVLAGIGIQTSLYALLRESDATIAIMKSLGATGRFITSQFVGMVLLLGAAGTLLGLGASLLLQLVFPALFAGILPANITLTIAWDAVLEGVLLGTTVVVLFSLLPLRRSRQLRPAFIFRKELGAAPRSLAQAATLILIGLFFAGLVVWQLEEIRLGLFFVLGLCGLLGLTGAGTTGLLALLRRHSPRNLVLRQAARGLFRPNNATRAIIITLSASLSVIFAIILIDHNLRATFIESYPPDLPNAYFLDIQPEQQQAFAETLGQAAEYYPIIRARLLSINNRPIDREQEHQRKRGDNLAREFNLTYRHVLLDDERMAEGRELFAGPGQPAPGPDEVPVSVLDTVADIGRIEMGDLLLFDVQGIPLPARVTSLRTRTESRVRPFFYFVFPAEILKDAPQTIFASARVEQPRLSEVQNALTARLPNISVIDIGATVEVLARIMGRMSAIVQFFTAFSIIAGLLIIVSSILATRLTRTREAVYFKVLGGTRAFVLKVFAWENLLLGLSCALLAGLLAHAGSWLVCRRIFDIAYQPLPGGTLLMIGATLLLVIGVGLATALPILRQKPIHFLRDEAQE
ncbi:MAG: FtsX-like permease family protein [Desulfobulbus sp.]|nr:MAG: FtsX-like permease family protein [Desulfobulbus sp.]